MKYIYGSDKDGYGVIYSDTPGADVSAVHGLVNKKLSQLPITLNDKVLLYFTEYTGYKYSFCAVKREQNNYKGGGNSYLISVDNHTFEDGEDGEYCQSFAVKFPVGEAMRGVIEAHGGASAPFGTASLPDVDSGFVLSAVRRLYLKEKLVIKLPQGEDFELMAAAVLVRIFRYLTVKMKRSLVAGASVTLRGLEQLCDIAIYPATAQVQGALVYGQDGDCFSAAADSKTEAVLEYITSLSHSERQGFFRTVYKFFESVSPLGNARWSDLCYEAMVCLGVAYGDDSTVSAAFIRCKTMQGFEGAYSFVKLFSQYSKAGALAKAILCEVDLAEIGKKLSAALANEGFERTMAKKEILSSLRLPWLMYKKGNLDFDTAYDTLIFGALDKHFQKESAGSFDLTLLRSQQAECIKRKERLTAAFATLPAGSAEEAFYLRAAELAEKELSRISDRIKLAEQIFACDSELNAICGRIGRANDFFSFYSAIAEYENKLAETVAVLAVHRIDWGELVGCWVSAFAAAADTAAPAVNSKSTSETQNIYKVLERVKATGDSFSAKSTALEDLINRFGVYVKNAETDRAVLKLRECCMFKTAREFSEGIHSLDKLTGAQLEYARSAVKAMLDGAVRDRVIDVHKEFNHSFCQTACNALYRSQGFKEFAEYFNIYGLIKADTEQLLRLVETNEPVWLNTMTHLTALFSVLSKERLADSCFVQEYNRVCALLCDFVQAVQTKAVLQEQSRYHTLLTALYEEIRGSGQRYYSEEEDTLAELIKAATCSVKAGKGTPKLKDKQKPKHVRGQIGAYITQEEYTDTDKPKPKGRAVFYAVLASIIAAIAALSGIALWLILKN